MISFKWPEGVPLPEGKGEGDEVVSFFKLRIGKDGNASVIEIDDTPLEKSEKDEEKMEAEAGPDNYDQSIDSMFLGGQNA